MNVNDNINMEYEARMMLNEEQYLNIRHHYISKGYPKRELVNENYYFDTPNLTLTNSAKVLRIRKINDEKYELTLKIQEEKGCLELNESLTYNEFNSFIKKPLITSQVMTNKLKESGIDISSLVYITNLKTERLEVELSNCLLVIDKNYYNKHLDYNIEIESTSESLAKSQLIEIIKEFNIPYQKEYINKAKRAIYSK